MSDSDRPEQYELDKREITSSEDPEVLHFLRDRGSAKVRLVVVDDHPIFLEGLIALLAEDPRLLVVGQATSGRQGLEEIRRCHPDLAIIDISMPDISGLEVTRVVREELPEIKVLILTMHEEPGFFFEALKQGASGYFLKGSSSDELISAIITIYGGDVYLPPSLALFLVQDFIEREKAGKIRPIEPLSHRESEVLHLIAQGFTNAEIAQHLTISLNTVKTHRLRIYQKLGFHKRSELLAFAMRNGLVS
jgi:two-component system response regulator NreC